MSLLDPIGLPVLSPAEVQYQAATRETGFGEYLGAKARDGFDFSLAGRATEALTSPSPTLGPLPADNTPEQNAAMGYKPGRRVTEDEWRKLKLDRPGLEFSGGGTVEYEQARTDAFDERRYRESLIARYQGGVLGQVAGFGAALVGSLPSPENFLPFVGEGLQAAMVARMGVIGGRAAGGALDATVGTILADAVVLPDLARRGEDVGAADFALDITLGAVIGSAFGAGSGLLARRAEGRLRRDALADAARAVRIDGVQRQSDAITTALGALANDEPVDVGPVLIGADATIRRRLLSGTAAPVERGGFDVTGLPVWEPLPPEESAANVPSSADGGATVTERPGIVPLVPEAVPGDIRSAIDAARVAHEGSTLALRVIPGEFTGTIARGDSLPPSRKWVNGEPTDKALNGTSAVSIGKGTSADIAKAMERLGVDRAGRSAFYYGDRVVLVAGEKAGRGADAGEVKIKDAKVVEIWRKGGEGAHPIVGRESIPAETPSSPAKEPPAPAAPKDAIAPFVTDYVARERELAQHPSIVEAATTVTRAPTKTGVEEAQRLAKDMGLDDPAELQDIAAMKRSGLLTAADEASMQRASETVQRANEWATAYEALSSCVVRFQ